MSQHLQAAITYYTVWYIFLAIGFMVLCYLVHDIIWMISHSDNNDNSDIERAYHERKD